MSAQISAYGRLAKDAFEIRTKTGTAMAAATMAVDVPEKEEQEDGTMWLSIVAFGHRAEDLLRCKKGDCVAVSGRLVMGSWKTDKGETRTQLKCIADSVLSARVVRPGGKRKAKSQSDAFEAQTRFQMG